MPAGIREKWDFLFFLFLVNDLEVNSSGTTCLVQRERKPSLPIWTNAAVHIARDKTLPKHSERRKQLFRGIWRF